MTRKPLPLSQRVRNNSEAAPWVIQEIIKLEQLLHTTQQELEISQKFYQLAIKERDYERLKTDQTTNTTPMPTQEALEYATKEKGYWVPDMHRALETLHDKITKIKDI